MKNIAIIPARSGSKRLPGKNIKLINGKPLIAYSIKEAISSKIFDTVHLSTDSAEYAEIGRKYGADVSFLRNVENASDKSSSWDMVEEVLLNFEKLGKYFDNFMLLQPTSPLRKANDIQNAFNLFANKNINAVVSVCEIDNQINGAIYLSKTTHFFENNKNIYSSGCHYYIMDEMSSIDIDTEDDFRSAALIIMGEKN